MSYRRRVVGLIKPARRPEGWKAPGPLPRADPKLLPRDDEELSFLTGEWRIFQKQQGHRWSMDDLVTAWVAGEHIGSARRLLDLGCGLGSVLLMNAWRFPDADVTGVEAQMDRAEMARRSIAWNGVEDRCRVISGDLRDPHLFAEERFEFITGTPPYFPPGAGTASEKAHAFPCRFEVRGGVEEYCESAARWLVPDGRFVVCTSALERSRVELGARETGFQIIEHTEFIPREGKPVLICVDVLTRAAAPRVDRTFTIRDRASQWTPWFRGVRDQMGMPSTPP
ncbi:MAG: methyltransferase [Archangium sp.]|nr:methyltransferase [Archangium sp.]